MLPTDPPERPILRTLKAPASDAPGRSRAIDSAALFDGAREIVIRHGGREYRLRRTRFDKLILTA
jgi:hemin uptake protein HemP